MWPFVSHPCAKNDTKNQLLHPWKINGWNINSMEVWLEDHFPFFSWVMAAGEPAVNLPGVYQKSWVFSMASSQLWILKVGLFRFIKIIPVRPVAYMGRRVRFTYNMNAWFFWEMVFMYIGQIFQLHGCYGIYIKIKNPKHFGCSSACARGHPSFHHVFASFSLKMKQLPCIHPNEQWKQILVVYNV